MKREIRIIDTLAVWESFLSQYGPGALFQSWYWGEVQKRRNIPMWRFGLCEGTELVGIFLVVKVRARRGPFLHLRHGPIFSAQKASYWQTVVTFLKTLARQEAVWFIRMNPLLAETQALQSQFRFLGLIPAPIHAMDGEICWVLDIDRPEEEILLGMRKTTRYEIRRAQKMGIDVTQSKEVKDLDDFHSLYQETAKRHGFVGHTGIDEEFSVFVKENKALLFLARFEGKIIAGAVIVFYENQAIYHHGASVNSKIPASYLVQWEAIKEARKRGLKVYNFWGIAPENAENHPWRGLTLFKKGFGGRQMDFIHAHDLPISPFYIVPRTIDLIRRWRKRYGS